MLILEIADRVDLVFDIYIQASLKAGEKDADALSSSQPPPTAILEIV